MIALCSAKSADAAKLEFKLEFLTVGGEPAVSGGVEWTGLAIIFASYWEAGVKSQDNADKDDDDDTFNRRPPQSESLAKTLQKDTHHQWILVEPGKYPEDKEIPLDEYAKL